MNIHPLNNAKTEWRLTLDDDIDMDTYHRLEQEVVDRLCQTLFEAEAKKLIVDLTTTKRISSLGLQLLLSMYKKCNGQEIQMILLNPSGQIRRILQILQFDRIFTIEYTGDKTDH
ncbi:MAG: STAS domain-containing protein [Anaerolineae bacterium]|nr:STAS domain-containing protein [Anaerolineae bacterium]